MAYFSPKRLNAQERVVRDGKERKGKGSDGELPGVSYLPLKFEIAEDKNIQERVSLEFIDFMECVTDVLQLMTLIKARHLRSVNPLPFALVREIRVNKKKTKALKIFERDMNTTGISHSVENLLRTKSTANNTARIQKSKMKKPNLKDTRGDLQDLIDIVGKKSRPIWQTVIKENPAVRNETNIKDEVEGRDKKDLDAHRILKKNNSTKVGVFKTHSEELLCNIQYMRSFHLDEVPEYQKQMDMVEAYFDGFTSVTEHKHFLETLSPHWFTDLLRLAIDSGIVLCQPVTDGFHKLGEFYHFNEHHDPFARGKLCFILQSLPIWDATRVTLQRAIEFILRDILNVPNPSKDLHDWLNVRRLPYVVLPPILSTHNEFGHTQTPSNTGVENDPKDKHANPKSHDISSKFALRM